MRRLGFCGWRVHGQDLIVIVFVCLFSTLPDAAQTSKPIDWVVGAEIYSARMECVCVRGRRNNVNPRVSRTVRRKPMYCQPPRRLRLMVML